VETADHILEELGTWWSLHAASADKPVETTPELPDMDSREIAVFEALGYDPQSTDTLSSVTGLPADQLMQSLLLLELQGLISSAPGGFQRIT
jgi:DNA processing protein